MTKSKSGFTLVELAIVIATIGILAAIVLTSYNAFQRRSRDTKRVADVANIAKALEIYYDENGQYPTASGTNSSMTSYWYTSDTTSWNTFQSALQASQAIDTLPTDPVNNAGAVTAAGNYNYAYLSATYCGVPLGQMYILVYRLESGETRTLGDGSCNTSPIGTTYTSAGDSYHRSVKTGS